jgi:hypothetical protein
VHQFHYPSYVQSNIMLKNIKFDFCSLIDLAIFVCYRSFEFHKHIYYLCRNGE